VTRDALAAIHVKYPLFEQQLNMSLMFEPAEKRLLSTTVGALPTAKKPIVCR
jgi:hypothetical protein